MTSIRRHVPLTLTAAGILALSALLVPQDPGAEGSVLDPMVIERLSGIFVNDDAGEVGSADILDGTLFGGDVSTQRGDVWHTNGTLTVAAGDPASGDDPGLPGIVVEGGPSGFAVGGIGLDARGGDAAEAGGIGVRGEGAPASGLGGTGVVAVGGLGGGDSGPGLEAYGADGAGGGGAGDGLVARGGSAEFNVTGAGVDATGGLGIGVTMGGAGVTALGGASEQGQGGNGVEGYGGAPDGDGVVGTPASAAGVGVMARGDLGVAGTLRTVQPHPTDPSLEIRLAPLSGDEAGTYVRGSGRIVGGRAVIVPPEAFRLATGADGLTVHLTAVGGPALLWVESKALDGIVVKASDDVAFDYVVSGVRRGFESMETIAANRTFVPDRRGVAYGAQYTEAYRQLLIDNGTLDADLTPRESTAARHGWRLADPEETR